VPLEGVLKQLLRFREVSCHSIRGRLSVAELRLVWPAPAKLNLFLHITGRRQDGYHLLQTIFQFLDRCDELRFSVRQDGRIRRIDSLAGVGEGEDLTLRAAHLLQRESGTRLGVDIGLDKRLPIGGGLGGGSSDAATTLIALNRIWQCGLNETQLAKLGLRLGADVPVFVRGRAAWAEGVGERLWAVELPQPWYLVVHPGVSISTAEVFSAPDLTRNRARIKIRDFQAGRADNVFEPVVRAGYPEVARTMDWLAQYGVARLTGTGACVFAAFDGEAEARRVLNAVPPPWVGFIARGLNRSPLFAGWD
jgi:4-diphosphocytidyl-2-C-methyl-D-erythritol kinase